MWTSDIQNPRQHSTRPSHHARFHYCYCKCEFSAVTVLHSCCSIALHGLGSGKVSLRHRLMAEQKLRGLLWKCLSLGDVQGQGRAAPTTYSIVFLHSTIGHASAEKPRPAHSRIALPRASNAPWSRWRSSSVSTFMHSPTRFREPKCSEFLQTERPQLMCKEYEYGGTLLRPIHPSLVIGMSSHNYLFLGSVSSSGTDGKSLLLNLLASISTKSPRAIQD